MIDAVLFDLYETLVTHFYPAWAPPPRSIAQRLGIDEDHFQQHWPRLTANGSVKDAATARP